MSDHRLVVRTPAQTRRRRILIGLLAAAALMTGWGLYMLGRMQASGAAERFELVRQESENDQQRLESEKRRLEAENKRLSEQLTALKRSDEVDQAASAELRDALEQMQSRVAELKKEVAFYRGIVSPKSGKAGLRVQAVSVERTEEPAVYDLQVTLIKPMRYERKISGRLKVRLQGVCDDASVSLDWSQVALDSGSELVFSFDYYQELGGAFRVPDNLRPTRVEVEVDPDAGGADAVTRTFRWKELTAKAG